jgi:hypothetical protein
LPDVPARQDTPPGLPGNFPAGRFDKPVLPRLVQVLDAHGQMFLPGMKQ